MVLGHKVEIHPGLVDELDDLQMMRIEIRIREFRAVVFLHVIKDANLHDRHSYDNCVGLASGLRGAT